MKVYGNTVFGRLICMHIYITFPPQARFSFSLTGCLTKVKEPILFYLPVNREKTDGFIQFPRDLARSEMQKIGSPIPFSTTMTVPLRAPIVYNGRFPWCNGYPRRKWIRRHEFKSWTRLIAFHIALIPLGKVWIQLFSLQLWVNSRTDLVLQPWWGK